MKKKITIIIPAYNEEAGIGKTLDELVPIAKQMSWQILVINDGSNDSTGELISNYASIQSINRKTNRGYGASLKLGVRRAKTDIIAFYDADGQHHPQDLLNLYNSFDDADMLVGSRGKDSHQSLIRKPGKWVLKKIANYLTGSKIPDINSGLRIVQRDILLKLENLFCDGFSYSTTSTIAFINMGYDVKYLPIKVSKREGKSSVKQVKHGMQTVMLMLRLIVLFNPLKIFIQFSTLFFVLAMINFGINDLHFNPFWINITTSTLLLILSAMMTFLIGLVVDQISELRKNQF